MSFACQAVSLSVWCWQIIYRMSQAPASLESVLERPTHHGLNRLIQGEPVEKIQEVVDRVIASTSAPAKVLLISILSGEIGSHERIHGALSPEQRLENEKILAILRDLSARVSAAATAVFDQKPPLLDQHLELRS